MALGSHRLGNAGLIQAWDQRALSPYRAKVHCEFLGMRVHVQINFTSNTFSTKHLRTSHRAFVYTENSGKGFVPQTGNSTI